MAGKKVFICAAAEDASYYGEITTALNAWEAPHTELGVVPGPVTGMPVAIEAAIRDCEVFLRLCTSYTKRSSAVNLTTEYFVRLLREDRRKGRQRRKLVNLILDPAYPLDDDERKTLYIMTTGKTRALWLEELAVSVGAATLTQQVSRRALLGMGVGAALTVASAGVAGTLLVRQRQQQSEPALPVRAKISGNPQFSFRLSDSPTFVHARLFQDGAIIYAQPNLFDTSNPQVDSSVSTLSVSDQQQRRIPITTSYPAQGQLLAAASGLFAFFFNASLPDNLSAALQVMSARDSRRLWSKDCIACAAPALANGAVYCPLQLETAATASTVTYEFSLRAFRAQDGAQLWESQDYDSVNLRTPAVADGRLYIGSTSHRVYCMDATTGKTRWSYLTRGPVNCTPAISDNVIYVGSEDGSLYALGADSGQLRWRFATTAGVVATPLIHDGVVYAGSRDAYIYALDARSGAMFWRAYTGVNPTTDDIPSRQIENTPAVYRNVLFATTNGGLYAFDTRTGAQRWRYIPVEEDAGVISQPVISDGLVLVGAEDNRVYAVNP